MGRTISRLGWTVVCCFSLCSLAWGQPCVDAPDGLASWWPGDGHPKDIVGKNRGTLQNGAGFARGLVRQAFSFPGGGAFVQTPVRLPQVGTLTMWVNPRSFAGSPSVFGIGGTHGLANGNDRLWITASGPGGGPGIPPNTMTVNLGSCCVNDLAILTPFSPGSWTHIALTFNYLADTYQLYINGIPLASSTAQRTVPSQPFRIGANTSDFGQNYFFNGVIDEVMLYRQSLSADEIRGIFAAGSGGVCKPPFGGTITGSSPTRIVCANLTTGRTVQILPRRERAWDCEAAGLVVHPGDQVRQTIIGTAD